MYIADLFHILLSLWHTYGFMEWVCMYLFMEYATKFPMMALWSRFNTEKSAFLSKEYLIFCVILTAYVHYSPLQL